MFIPALTAAKISILLLYLDIARQSQKFLRVGSYVTLAIVAVGGAVLTLITAFRCRPVQAAYNLTTQNSSCIPFQTIWLTAWPINIATDLAILVLPIPALTTLPLTPLRKSAVILSFILGVIFIGVIDVARIYSLQLAVINSGREIDALPSSPGVPVNAGIALMWSAVEVNAAIIGASIPTLPPVMKRLTPSNPLRLEPRSSARAFVRLFSSQRESENAPSINELTIQNSQGTGCGCGMTQVSTAPVLARNQEPQMNSGATINTAYTETMPQRPWASDSPRERQHSVYFGFINMARPKCIVDMCGSESAKYCAMINILLFLNGFTYVMLFSINGSLPIVKTRPQAVGMSSASYIGAGIFSPSIGYVILRHFGFKATIATSLAIWCVGTLIFWPCAAVGSYPGFIVCNVLVGFSLGIMEMAADTFNSLCGLPEYAVVRVLLGTGVEGIGGALSSVLTAKVLSIDADDSHNLMALQWAYLGIALFTVLLGLFYWHVPLPQITDSELRARPDILWIDPSKKHLGVFPIIFTSLGVAVLSGFCSAGALASLRNFIGDALSIVSTKTQTTPKFAISDFQTGLSVVYAVGNFLFAFLCLFISPAVLLLMAYGCGITLAVLIFADQFPSAASLQVITLALSIIEGPIPNLVIAIGLRGLGWWTGLACCLLVSGCSLGACIWPWVMLAVSSRNSAQYTFCVVIALFVAGSIFPVYLNLIRSSHDRERPPAWAAIRKVVLRHFCQPQV